MRMVFMGTPDFAVNSLERLIADGHDIVGVFTQPDKPKGRHGVLSAPPVKELALKYDIPVYQPDLLKNDETKSFFASLGADLALVVAYGKILPEEFLNAPKYGCINMHASLLPKLRGAAPIQWSIINGEKRSGVTAMQMDKGLDTGDILLSESVEIRDDETAQELHDELSVLGAQVMRKTLLMLQKGVLLPIRQDDSQSTYAPILTKELSAIDWQKSALQIHNQIRGLYPWPGASAVLNGKTLKIHSAKLLGKTEGEPGEVVFNDRRLCVACGDGNAVELLVIQAPGKKAMPVTDYLRGNPVVLGTIFE